MRRYDSYKDSGVEWIGEIPIHWKVVKLKRLTKVKRGSSPRPIDDPKYFDDLGEFKWVRISDVTNSERYLYETSETLSELGSSLSTKIYPNDLFLSIAGSVGKPIITKVKCCIHDGFVWFDGLKYDSEFLYYTFLLGTCFSGLGKWGTQLNLNTDTVGDIFIPLIDLELQQQIVSYLDTKTSLIDSLIEKTKLKIQLLKENRTSLINEVVTKGLNPNVEMKDSGVEWIGEIPSHWECIGIKLVLELLTDFESNGSFSSVKENVTVLDDVGPVWYVRMTDLENGNLRNDNCKYCDLKTYEFLFKTKLEGGELLITKRGEIGKVYLFPKNSGLSTLGPNSYLLKLNENKVSPPFLFHFYKSDYGQITLKLLDKSTTIGSLYKDDLKNSKVVIPPLSEQKQIVSYLDEHTQLIDKTISVEERRIDTLKEYRQSLISEVVTGKRKVVTHE
jgi:type I restriction enzyme S subunit